ncbi:MAG: spermidine synthase [Planctomycetota bacterium]
MTKHATRRHRPTSRAARPRPHAVAAEPLIGPDAWIFAAFFASGAAGLIYQVSWLRQIGLLFGHTVQAASIVVGGFFAGLGLGYLLAVPLLRRVRPLMGYAAAEWLAAGWACLIPLLLALLEGPALAPALHHANPVVQTAIRSVVCFALLLPATIALGATLPFIAEYLNPVGRQSGARVPIAYALNTVGALTGVLAATMVLLVVVGVTTSGYLAAAISVASGCIAWGVCRSRGDQTTRDKAEEEPASATAGTPWFWFGLVALSGFGTLALEMLYNRMFALVFHNSVYTFGVVLAIFLAALALGAALAPRLIRRFGIERVIAWACMIGGAAVALSMLVFGAVTGLKEFQAGQSFSGHMAAVLGLVALIVALPVTVLGVLLPAAWQGAQPGRAGSGRTVGLLTAANTIAATVGSLLTAFLLIPVLGLWPTTLCIAGLFYLVGSCLVLRRRRWAGVVAVGGILVASSALGLIVLSRCQDMLPAGTRAQVVRRWQTPYGWIDVVSEPAKNWLALRENLHYVHGDTAGSLTREVRQGHLPLLLHRQPRDVLFLGMGTGLTAGAALHHPAVQHVATVELIPQVVEAARLFKEANNNLLDDPRTEVHVDDARHWLLASDESFDVIVSDLFVPWQSQAGYLYTTDHYDLVRKRLKQGGIFCQWLALNQVGRREFEIIADSFASVFPVTTLWWGRLTPQQSMVMLVGSEESFTLEGTNLKDRLEALRDTSEKPDSYLQSVTYVYRLYAGRWQRPPGPLNSDEYPRIEFLTPVTYRNRGFLTYQRLIDYFDSVLTKLSPDGVSFDPVPGVTMEDHTTKHAQQRQVLTQQMSGQR